MTRYLPYPDTKILATRTFTRQLKVNRKADIMKRTEKIEIRVSQEEKDSLTQLAKQDGESVSSLIRGLVEKYMALNTASTTRKLPKWQIAAGLIAAAFIGHGLTLIPMHLHDRGHQSASAPIYYVHGAIGVSAFGISVSENEPIQRVTLDDGTGKDMIIKLKFKPNVDGEGILNLSICEENADKSCITSFGNKMDISRRSPSVLGNQTTSGKPIHIFVQEMA